VGPGRAALRKNSPRFRLFGGYARIGGKGGGGGQFNPAVQGSGSRVTAPRENRYATYAAYGRQSGEVRNFRQSTWAAVEWGMVPAGMGVGPTAPISSLIRSPIGPGDFAPGAKRPPVRSGGVVPAEFLSGSYGCGIFRNSSTVSGARGPIRVRRTGDVVQRRLQPATARGRAVDGSRFPGRHPG